MNKKSRLEKLEFKTKSASGIVVIVDGGGDSVTINGKIIPRVEYDALYPEAPRRDFITVKTINGVSMDDL